MTASPKKVSRHRQRARPASPTAAAASSPSASHSSDTENNGDVLMHRDANVVSKRGVGGAGVKSPSLAPHGRSPNIMRPGLGSGKGKGKGAKGKGKGKGKVMNLRGGGGKGKLLPAVAAEVDVMSPVPSARRQLRPREPVTHQFKSAKNTARKQRKKFTLTNRDRRALWNYQQHEQQSAGSSDDNRRSDSSSCEHKRRSKSPPSAAEGDEPLSDAEHRRSASPHPPPERGVGAGADDPSQTPSVSSDTSTALFQSPPVGALRPRSRLRDARGGLAFGSPAAPTLPLSRHAARTYQNQKDSSSSSSSSGSRRHLGGAMDHPFLDQYPASPTSGGSSPLCSSPMPSGRHGVVGGGNSLVGVMPSPRASPMLTPGSGLFPSSSPRASFFSPTPSGSKRLTRIGGGGPHGGLRRSLFADSPSKPSFTSLTDSPSTSHLGAPPLTMIGESPRLSPVHFGSVDHHHGGGVDEEDCFSIKLKDEPTRMDDKDDADHHRATSSSSRDARPGDSSRDVSPDGPTGLASTSSSAGSLSTDARAKNDSEMRDVAKEEIVFPQRSPPIFPACSPQTPMRTLDSQLFLPSMPSPGIPRTKGAFKIGVGWSPASRLSNPMTRSAFQPRANLVASMTPGPLEQAMKSSNILPEGGRMHDDADDDSGSDAAFEVAPHVLRGEATPPPASPKENGLGSATTVRDDDDEKMIEGTARSGGSATSSSSSSSGTDAGGGRRRPRSARKRVYTGRTSMLLGSGLSEKEPSGSDEPSEDASRKHKRRKTMTSTAADMDDVATEVDVEPRGRSASTTSTSSRHSDSQNGVEQKLRNSVVDDLTLSCESPLFGKDASSVLATPSTSTANRVTMFSPPIFPRTDPFAEASTVRMASDASSSGPKRSTRLTPKKSRHASGGLGARKLVSLSQKLEEQAIARERSTRADRANSVDESLEPLPLDGVNADRPSRRKSGGGLSLGRRRGSMTVIDHLHHEGRVTRSQTRRGPSSSSSSSSSTTAAASTTTVVRRPSLMRAASTSTSTNSSRSTSRRSRNTPSFLEQQRRRGASLRTAASSSTSSLRQEPNYVIYGDDEDAMTDDGERTIAASSPIRGHHHGFVDADARYHTKAFVRAPIDPDRAVFHFGRRRALKVGFLPEDPVPDTSKAIYTFRRDMYPHAAAAARAEGLTEKERETLEAPIAARRERGLHRTSQRKSFRLERNADGVDVLTHIDTDIRRRTAASASLSDHVASSSSASSSKPKLVLSGVVSSAAAAALASSASAAPSSAMVLPAAAAPATMIGGAGVSRAPPPAPPPAPASMPVLPNCNSTSSVTSHASSSSSSMIVPSSTLPPPSGTTPFVSASTQPLSTPTRAPVPVPAPQSVTYALPVTSPSVPHAVPQQQQYTGFTTAPPAPAPTPFAPFPTPTPYVAPGTMSPLSIAKRIEEISHYLQLHSTSAVAKQLMHSMAQKNPGPILETPEVLRSQLVGAAFVTLTAHSQGVTKLTVSDIAQKLSLDKADFIRTCVRLQKAQGWPELAPHVIGGNEPAPTSSTTTGGAIGMSTFSTPTSTLVPPSAVTPVMAPPVQAVSANLTSASSFMPPPPPVTIGVTSASSAASSAAGSTGLSACLSWDSAASSPIPSPMVMLQDASSTPRCGGITPVQAPTRTPDLSSVNPPPPLPPFQATALATSAATSHILPLPILSTNSMSSTTSMYLPFDSSSNASITAAPAGAAPAPVAMKTEAVPPPAFTQSSLFGALTTGTTAPPPAPPLSGTGVAATQLPPPLAFPPAPIVQ